MKVKELFVTIDAKVRGLKKLEAFNKEMKQVMALLKEFNKAVKSMSSSKTEEALAKADAEVSKEGSNRNGKKGFLASLQNAPIVASIVYIGRAVLDLSRKIGSLVLSFSQASYELLKLNRNFGVSTDAIQQFGYAAVASGVKMSDFNSAIAGLRKQSADIMLGRGNISPYALLGLNPHEDPEKLLVHLQQRLRELPESIGTAFASDLGLSPDMINFVRSGDFARMQARPKLSRSDLNAIEQSRKLLLDVMNMFSLLGQKMLAYLSPIIKNVFGRLNHYIKLIISNTTLLKTTIIGVILAISTALFTLSPHLSAMMATLTAIALIIEDLVKMGGRGTLAWVEYLIEKIVKGAIEVTDRIEETFGLSKKMNSFLEESGIRDGFGKFLSGWEAVQKFISGGTTAFVPGNARVMLESKQTVSGTITLKDMNGQELGKGTVGSSSSGSDIILDTDLSGTTGD